MSALVKPNSARAIASADRQKLWDFLLAQKGTFTQADAVKATGQRPRSLARQFLKLVDAQQIKGAIFGGPDYTFIGERRADPPVISGLAQSGAPAQSNMWRAMRIMREFTPRDLSAHCTTPDVIVSELTARKYCGQLLDHGYLRVLQKGRQNHPARYRFVEDTGPEAPMIRLVPRLYDPNRKALVEPVSAKGGRS